MKKTFRIENLECANCAAKMERGIRALDGVTGCSVNFLTAKLALEADDDKIEAVVEAARKLIRKFEPKASLI